MNTLTFTLIQTNLCREDKTANLQTIEQKINSIKDKTEIVILPETFSTGFTTQPASIAENMDEYTINWMKRVAQQKRIILTGSVVIKENNRYYNRLIWMLPTGDYGIYNKRHLFAYAEEDKYYTAGNKRLITSVKGWKINLQICYDLRFPVWARQQSACAVNDHPDKPEYDVLIYVANWPKARKNAWATLLHARAIENQCYTIGVNCVGDDNKGIPHSGDSMVVSPLGDTLYTCSEKEDIFTIALEKENIEKVRSKYPFWKDADSFRLL